MTENRVSFTNVNSAEPEESETRRDNRQRFKTKKKNGNTYGGFRGKSKDMEGHVFQVHSEQRRKRQFELTLRQLQVFVSTKFNKQAKYLAPLFDDLSLPVVPKPTLPTYEVIEKDKDGNDVVVEKSTDFEKAVFSEKVKMWIKEEANLESTVQSLITIIIEQCSELMQNRLLAENNYELIIKTRNISLLLKAIRAISSQVETNISIYDAVDEAKRRYYRSYQSSTDTNATFLNDYRALIDTLTHYKSNIYEDSGLIAHEQTQATMNGSPISADDARIIVRNKMQGIDFLK